MIELTNPFVRLILGFSGVAILTAVGFYVISRIRLQSSQQAPTPEEMLLNFRELHREGVLDDDEFRTIRKQLSQQVVHNALVHAVPLGLTDTGLPPTDTPFDSGVATGETRSAGDYKVETHC